MNISRFDILYQKVSQRANSLTYLMAGEQARVYDPGGKLWRRNDRNEMRAVIVPMQTLSKSEAVRFVGDAVDLLDCSETVILSCRESGESLYHTNNLLHPDPIDLGLWIFKTGRYPRLDVEWCPDHLIRRFGTGTYDLFMKTNSLR